MPAYTEARIHQLVKDAIAATSEADIDRILPELRSAMHEHIRLAKESLGAQASALQRPFDAFASLACSGQALGPLVKARALRDDAA